MSDINKVRNFAIIAHIDHGKSTIADSMIQICGGLSKREMKEQVLDSIEWNASDIASGTYILQINNENYMSTQKLVLLK